MARAIEPRRVRSRTGWVNHKPGQLLTELRALRARLKAMGEWPDPVDRSRLFHPDTIAATRAHRRHCAGAHKRREPCTAPVDPADLDEIWAGQARMAAARQAAGQPLTIWDIEALHRVTGPAARTPPPARQSQHRAVS